MPLRFDESTCPLISVTFDGRLTDEELETYHATLLAQMKRAQSERRKYVWVIDAGTSEGTTARQRQLMASFVNENRRLIKEASLGSGLVQRSAVQRGVLTALLWLFKQPVPLRTFARREEAVAWAKAELTAWERESQQATPG